MLDFVDRGRMRFRDGTRKDQDTMQIGFFDRGIAPAAEFFERMLPPPLGLSLIAIGRKN